MDPGYAPRGLSLSAVVTRLLTMIGLDPATLPYIPTAQKAAASGVASLDSSSLVVQPAKLVQTSAPGNTAGAVGVNGNELYFGVGAAQRQAERVDRKGAALGYAALDGGGTVPAAQLAGKLITGITTARKIGSYSASVPAASTSDLATVTRAASEHLVCHSWVQENAVIGFGGAPTGVPDQVIVWLERTANANEVKVKATNTSAVSARTVDVLLLAIVP